MKVSEKVKENLFRRVLIRRGFTLEKSRRRDRLALDFGRYRVMKKGRVVAGDMTFKELVTWMAEHHGIRRTK